MPVEAVRVHGLADLGDEVPLAGECGEDLQARPPAQAAGRSRERRRPLRVAFREGQLGERA